MSDLSFQRDIRPLFRDKHVESMSRAFDLSAYEDVRDHAQEIHAQLAAGSCDGPWPAEDVERFARWMDAGLPR